MAASEERLARACAAMKNSYGIPAKAVRKTINQLLRVNKYKWEFIEDNNYRVILEYDKEKIKNVKSRRGESDQHVVQVLQSPLEGALTKGPNSNALLQIEDHGQTANLQNKVIDLRSDDDDDDEEPNIPSKRRWSERKKYPVQSNPCKRSKTSNFGTTKDEEKEADELQIKIYDDQSGNLGNIRSRLGFDGMQTEIPMKRHETRGEKVHESISSDNKALFPINHQDRAGISCEFGTSSGKNTNVTAQGTTLESRPLDMKGECSHNSETSQFDIASSDDGAVKIALLYSSSRKSNLNRTNLKAITKVENKFRKVYGITDPNFSVMKLLQEICQCYSEISSGEEDSDQVTQISNICSNPGEQDNVNTNNACQDSSRMQPGNTNDLTLTQTQITHRVKLDVPSHHVNGCNDKNNVNFCGENEMETKVIINDQASNSSRLKVVMKHQNYLTDITLGKERVKIPLLNDNGAMELPEFFYIAKNIVFEDAYVNFSIARISDDDCCSHCFGDCLSSELPCACAGETRGEFAYTPEELVKETFLDEAITMSRKPKRQHFYYCENCPLEKNPSEKYKRKRSCKGHLMRKFIKECWSKCGCNKKCGNRVVQRGITATLQVFNAPNGKGWGLRTVHGLKKGTFVCEYVGEIVTNQELHLRNKKRTGKERHTYPVLLDADWGSERILKDEEALCLDATLYGNCGRFINHRCDDANLVEIPVEIETPDHHYYHIAFFTTRNVEPMEELTWDYGIQFDDRTHPIKAFNCKCGSEFCRDKEISFLS